MDKRTKMLINAITKDVKKIGQINPKLRGKKHSAFLVGVLFEGGHIHTIYPEPTLAHQMIKRMEEEIKKKLNGEIKND
jgi:hypothetical protein